MEKLLQNAIKAGIKAFGYGKASRNVEDLLRAAGKEPPPTTSSEGLVMGEGVPFSKRVKMSELLDETDELPDPDEPLWEYGYLFDENGNPLLEMKDFINRDKIYGYEAGEHTLFEIDNDLLGEHYIRKFMKDRPEVIDNYLRSLKDN